MITIASFSKPEEAHMLRLRLEAGGVSAYIENENLVQIDWMFSNAMGGVRVLIVEEDADRAKEILEDAPLAPDSTGMPECPRCSSTTSPDERPRRWAFLSMLLVGFPLLVSKTRWRCSDCGHAWNEKNQARRDVSDPS